MKSFECNPKCKTVFVEAIIFGCPDCIKKRELRLTTEQSNEVEGVIKKYYPNEFLHKN